MSHNFDFFTTKFTLFQNFDLIQAKKMTTKPFFIFIFQLMEMGFYIQVVLYKKDLFFAMREIKK